MESQSDLFSSELKIDNTGKAHIRSLASWAMVIVVVAVVGYVLNILQLFINSNEPAEIQSEGFATGFLSGQSNVGGTIITVLIGLAINYFLYRFASTVGSSISGLSPEKFSNSFRNLKIYFAITTIFMILILLVLLIAVLALL